MKISLKEIRENYQKLANQEVLYKGDQNKPEPKTIRFYQFKRRVYSFQSSDCLR